MQFDYSKLTGKIVEILGDKKTLAERMGISYMTMMNRMHSRRPFDQREILEVCELLGINRSEIPDYFFVTKVS